MCHFSSSIYLMPTNDQIDLNCVQMNWNFFVFEWNNSLALWIELFCCPAHMSVVNDVDFSFKHKMNSFKMHHPKCLNQNDTEVSMDILKCATRWSAHGKIRFSFSTNCHRFGNECVNTKWLQLIHKVTKRKFKAKKTLDKE